MTRKYEQQRRGGNVGGTENRAEAVVGKRTLTEQLQAKGGDVRAGVAATTRGEDPVRGPGAPNATDESYA